MSFGLRRSLLWLLHFSLVTAAVSSCAPSNSATTPAPSDASSKEKAPVNAMPVIHVFVALADNVNQDIVPVSASLGNGDNPTTNLYWARRLASELSSQETKSGSCSQLLKGMYFWTWDTQEVLEMIRWMREFNKSGKGRVQFTGFDMQTPDVAMQIVNDFVAKHDTEFMEDMRRASEQAKAAPRADGPPFAVATASFPVEVAAGKRIRYSGYIKTEGITREWAGLWWRVDGKSGVLAFDNMKDRGATGTTDWKRYEIDLQVPADATNINFGTIHPGDGSAWFDGLSVTIDGEPYREKTKFDLDFESPSLVGFYSGGAAYQIRLDKRVAHSGNQSLLMRYAPPPPIANGGGVASAAFPAGSAVGRRVRLSGYIKTRDVTQGFAGLWLRVDGPSGVLAFDNMQDRGITGTSGWQRYEVELPVPAEATNVVFGAIFPANGTGWFDSLKIEVDDAPYPAGDIVALDFESPTPVGFHTTPGDAYQVEIDRDVFHTGKQSLRMKYVGPASAPPKSVDPKTAIASWQAVVRHLQDSRARMRNKVLQIAIWSG